MLKSIKGKVKWARELFPFFMKAYRHGKTLSLPQDNLKKIKKDDILLFCTMKDEGHRLEFFLQYYRQYGVDHFIFVDNASTDGTEEILSKYDDVTRFYTTDSYKESNFGMHWLNYLLFRYGRGHWCLTCDPDEFLVYPYCDTRDLKDLTAYLSSIREDAMFAMMVDMYSDKPIEQAVYQPGQDPLEVCPYYDGSGYSKMYIPNYRNLFVQGGVRRRVFSKNSPEKAPALNKVPLIKWKWNYFYVESMHMALPRRLNNSCYITKTSGALLHFKFISQLGDKVAEEMVAKQHFNDSAEYKQYGEAMEKSIPLYHDKVSVRYTGWKELAKRGLINAGEW